MAGVGDHVERLTRRRAMISIVLGAFLASRSTSIFIFEITPAGLGVSMSEGLSPVAWLVWFIILLLFALIGGGLGRSAPVRRSLNDEGTAAHWRGALLAGFGAMMLGAAVCFLASYFLRLTARDAVQVMLSLGVGMALMRFGGLERNALHARPVQE